MKAIFYSAALFNWFIAVWIGFFIESFFAFFAISPVPTEILMAQWFSTLVVAFGLGYFWIALDMVKNRQIILLGGVAKMMLVTTGVLNVMYGMVSWQILIPLAGDFLYALAFFAVYRSIPPKVAR